MLPSLLMHNVMSLSNVITSSKRFYNHHVSRQERNVMGNSTATDTLVTNTSVLQQRNKVSDVTRPCVFCKSDHFNDCCTQYIDVYDRKKQLQRQGRCLVCLKIGHTFKECTNASSKSCYYCKRFGHHHRSICPTKVYQSVKSTGSDDDKTSVNLSLAESSLASSSVVSPSLMAPNLVPESGEVLKSVENVLPVPVVEKTPDAAAVVSNTLLAGGERVLLQTAQVTVCGKDGLWLQARVLMDSASHRTFMTEQMAQRLNLQSIRTELLSVSTFGTKRAQSLETYVVDFNLMTKQGSSILLHANVLKQITSPIQHGSLSQADIKFLQAIVPEQLATAFPHS